MFVASQKRVVRGFFLTIAYSATADFFEKLDSATRAGRFLSWGPLAPGGDANIVVLSSSYFVGSYQALELSHNCLVTCEKSASLQWGCTWWCFTVSYAYTYIANQVAEIFPNRKRKRAY